MAQILSIDQVYYLLLDSQLLKKCNPPPQDFRKKYQVFIEFLPCGRAFQCKSLTIY
uniref:Uncharacterized protein n=1 Tax=Cyanothece sp. (strain PCC 7425 / ATCC 29141) TaxID=395961 RepID=B8HXZ2_CYAP4